MISDQEKFILIYINSSDYILHQKWKIKNETYHYPYNLYISHILIHFTIEITFFQILQNIP
jgi:hypothetical protein